MPHERTRQQQKHKCAGALASVARYSVVSISASSSFENDRSHRVSVVLTRSRSFQLVLASRTVRKCLWLHPAQLPYGFGFVVETCRFIWPFEINPQIQMLLLIYCVWIQLKGRPTAHWPKIPEYGHSLLVGPDRWLLFHTRHFYTKIVRHPISARQHIRWICVFCLIFIPKFGISSRATHILRQVRDCRTEHGILAVSVHGADGAGHPDFRRFLGLRPRRRAQVAGVKAVAYDARRPAKHFSRRWRWVAFEWRARNWQIKSQSIFSKSDAMRSSDKHNRVALEADRCVECRGKTVGIKLIAGYFAAILTRGFHISVQVQPQRTIVGSCEGFDRMKNTVR